MRFLVGVVAAAALFAGCGGEGATLQRSAGKRIDVGGHRLYIECDGEGKPTIVLEAGAGGDHEVWQDVQPSLARETRVCSYDRAGLGLSDSGEGESSETVVEDLHTLLERAAVDAPYVLAGHSLGGVYIAAYANEHPDDVAGLVFVDSVDVSGPPRLGARPLAVLVASESASGDMPAVSTNAWLVLAPESGHYIQNDEPELTVEAIRHVVRAARTGGNLPSCDDTAISRLDGKCAVP